MWLKCCFWNIILTGEIWFIQGKNRKLENPLYDFPSHPNSQKLVLGPHPTAREAKKFSLYSGGEISHAAESIT